MYKYEIRRFQGSTKSRYDLYYIEKTSFSQPTEHEVVMKITEPLLSTLKCNPNSPEMS